MTIIDFSAEFFNFQSFEKEVIKADIIGITILSFSIENSIEIIKQIKKIKPEIKIIIGGPHCNLFPKKALEETGADICVQGDGELVILDIKKAMEGKKDFSKIPGIYYRENKKIKKGAELELTQNLDSVPFPARHLVKKYNYGREYYPRIQKGEFTSIVTSRGCPYNCKFCSRNSISMKKYRYRSIDNIIEELKELKSKGYKYVAFEDDSFLFNNKHAHELFDKIIKEQINMKYIITAVRVDSADEKLFEKMKRAGVTHIQFGLESGNQKVLDYYNKKTTIENIKYAVNLSNKLRFFIIGSFILGAPFETKKDLETTINFAKTLPLDSVSFLPLKYVAGSEIWCDAVENKKISDDEYIVYADSKRDLGVLAQKEVLNMSIKANRDYYLRPGFYLRLFIKSLRNDDLGFLQSYISLFLSNIKEGFKFFGVS